MTTEVLQDSTGRRRADGAPYASAGINLLSALFTAPQRLVWAVILLGGALRFYHYNALSLWLDEGSTVQYARLPWRTVLGFDGPYDTHPPLYYALVKLFSLAFSEAVAGRLLSVLAGTLTVALVYALGTRLAGRWVGLLSSLTLAVNPLHIWYSQEARQYALNVLLVGVSYLALVAFFQSARTGGAVIYGLSILASLYVEYSAVYALLPQVVIVVAILARHRLRAWPLIAAGLAAVVGFVPWVPWLLSISSVVSQQGMYLPTSAKIGNSLLSLTGLGGNSASIAPGDGGYFWGTKYAAWDLNQQIRPLLAAGVGLSALLGLYALTRKSIVAAIVPVCLLATIPVAALVSMVTPGYIERTIMYAVLGWSLVVGAAGQLGFTLARDAARSYATKRDGSRGFAGGAQVQGPPSGRKGWTIKAVGAATVLLCLLLVLASSAVTVRAIYLGALKQDWRGLAVKTVVSAGNGLVVTYPTLAEPLMGVYQPQLFGPHEITIKDNGDLPDLTGLGVTRDTGADKVWFAYMQVLDIDKIRQEFEAQGYKLVSHAYYPIPASSTFTKRAPNREPRANSAHVAPTC